MFRKTVMAVTLFALTAPMLATATFAGSGDDQLAKQLGVQPGVYSTSVLAALQSARNDDDSDAFNFILSQANGVVSRASTDGIVSSGAAQLAENLGVAPGAYSLADLTKLSTAINDNDSETIAFILNGGSNGNVTGDVGVVTPGKAQMAATVGVDPAAYSTADLAKMVLDIDA